MKSMLFAVLLVSMTSVTLAQFLGDNMMQYLMFSQLMGGRGRSGSTGSATGQATSYPAGATSAGATGTAATNRGASRGLGSLLGNRGMGLMAMTGGLGDTLQDMSMCNMMPRGLRMMCYMGNVGM